MKWIVKKKIDKLLACKCSKTEYIWLEWDYMEIYTKIVEIMASWSGVLMLGRDSNGPTVNMHAFILNIFTFFISTIGHVSIDVAGKTECIFRMCMEALTTLFVRFSFLLNKSINYGPMVRGSDIREGNNWSVNMHAFI